MISAGQKIAKATAIRFVSSKAGSVGIEVGFQIGLEGRLSWTGWLTEKALEQTMKTLVEVLEFNGDEATVVVPDGDMRQGMMANQDCINRVKDVQLVVENETYEGKTFAKIKWVNNVGGGQFAGCSPEIVKNQLSSIGFKAAFLSAKQGLPPKAPVAPVTPTIPNFGVSKPEMDLGF